MRRSRFLLLVPLALGCADAYDVPNALPQTVAEDRCIHGGEPECDLVHGEWFGARRIVELCAAGVDAACWVSDEPEVASVLDAWCADGNARACLRRGKLPLQQAESMCQAGDVEACIAVANTRREDIEDIAFNRRRLEVALTSASLDHPDTDLWEDFVERGRIEPADVQRASSAFERVVALAESACAETGTYRDCLAYARAANGLDEPPDREWARIAIDNDLLARCDDGVQPACDRIIGDGIVPGLQWADRLPPPTWALERRREWAEPACWDANLAGCARLAALAIDHADSGVTPESVVGDLRRALEYAPRNEGWPAIDDAFLAARMEDPLRALELAQEAIEDGSFDNIPELGHVCHGGRRPEFTCSSLTARVAESFRATPLSTRLAHLDVLQHGCSHAQDQAVWCNVLLDVVEEGVASGLLSPAAATERVLEACRDEWPAACTQLLEQPPETLRDVVAMACGHWDALGALLRFEGDLRVDPSVCALNAWDLENVRHAAARSPDLAGMYVTAMPGWLLLEGIVFSQEQRDRSEWRVRQLYEGPILSDLQFRAFDCCAQQPPSLVGWDLEDPHDEENTDFWSDW